MILIYSTRGVPGETSAAREDARGHSETTYHRTVRGYDGPEANVSVVYTDSEAIRSDYADAGVEVRSLSGETITGAADGPQADGQPQSNAPTSDGDTESSESSTSGVGGIDLSDTPIGEKKPQDMTYDELYAIAQDLDIEGRSNMDKQRLFQAIRDIRRND